MRFIGVIPARYHSSRFPGKSLAPIAGKPMIQWVYERAALASMLAETVIATDDERILAAAHRFGCPAVLTSPSHRSGTDRVAEVARQKEADIFVNIQGDEPLIAPATIDAVCRAFEGQPALQVATARVEIREPLDRDNPNVVKVVVDHRGRALYFSRARIPYQQSGQASVFKHLGIYAYRRNFLLDLESLKPSALEKTESLEQLRFLENGIAVQVVAVEQDSVGVDTPEDIERVRPLVENMANRLGSGVLK